MSDDNGNTLKSLFARLAEPFLPSELEWRVAPGVSAANESGIALAYLTARAVMDRLDMVVGPENWKDDYRAGPLGGVVCGLSLRINGEWITKVDGAENTDIEAVKGGISDALKRAAVKWGIGRYLYSFPDVWCKVAGQGKSWRLLERPAVPAWAYPADYQGEKEKGFILIPRNAIPAAPKTVPQPAQEAKKSAVVPPKAPAAVQKVPAAAQKAPASAPQSPSEDSSAKLARAGAYVVPAAFPFAGKPLSEAVKDPTLGLGVVKFLAGMIPNRAKAMFVPVTPEETALLNAAKYLISNLPTAA